MSAFDAIPKPMPPAELNETVAALRQAVTAATATISTPDGAVEVTAGPGNAIVGLGFGRAAYRYSPERLGALVVDTARQATAEATSTITEAVRTARRGRADLPGLLGGALPEVPRPDQPTFADMPTGGPANDKGWPAGDHGRRAGDQGRQTSDQRWRADDQRRPANDGRQRADDDGRQRLADDDGRQANDRRHAADTRQTDDRRRTGDDWQQADRVLRRVSEESQRQLAGYTELRAELSGLTATARSADGGVSAQVRAGGELMAVDIATRAFQHDPATLANIVHTTVMTATARAAMLMAERVQQLTGPRLDIRSLVEKYQTAPADDDDNRS